MAAQEGHGNVVQALQENNANLNQATKPCGKNLVYMAAVKGHLDVVKMLLEHDANPDLATTIDGATPVYAVVDQGYLECLKVLLEHGANPNQATTSTGSISLHVAAFKGSLMHNSWSKHCCSQLRGQCTFLLRNPIRPPFTRRLAGCCHRLVADGSCCSVADALLHYIPASARTDRPG